MERIILFEIFLFSIFTLLTIMYVRTLYKEDEIIKRVKKQVAILFPEVNGLYIKKSDKSMIYKKKNIYLKIRSDDGEYYSINTLVYVCLHEISHIICVSVQFNQM